MKIEVSVKPGAKTEGVTDLGGGCYRVQVKARAVEGRANEAVRETLAEHFGVSKSRVQVTAGLKSRKKRVEIIEREDRL